VLYKAGKPEMAAVFLGGHDLVYFQKSRDLLMVGLDPDLVERIKIFYRSIKLTGPY
jgi:hypothetical protein